MNKKALAVLIMLTLSYMTMPAQTIKATFGITGGGIATQMMTDPATSSPIYMNGYGGVFATIGFKNFLGLRTGVNYMLQGADYNISDTDMMARQQYIQVPVSIQYNIRSFISVEAGVYQNILVKSSFEERGKENVMISPDEGALKYNFGVLAGLSFNFGRFVFLNLRYHYSLSKSYIIYGKGYPQGIISAGLGFNIISTRKTAF